VVDYRNRIRGTGLLVIVDDDEHGSHGEKSANESEGEDEDKGTAVAEVMLLLNSDEPRRPEVVKILLVFTGLWAVE